MVEAIRKQIGKLNAIIPSEHKNVQLPPMKMQEVNVKQLFEALENASYKSVKRGQTVHSFRSGFQSVGQITPESVWYFFAPNIESDDQPNIVRYYQLGRFLKEYKIEDITTAIQAGWKMLGEENPPKLNFHEDTKLLIAVGPIDKLELIHSVLQELERGLHPDSRGYGPPRQLPAPTLPSQVQ